MPYRAIRTQTMCRVCPQCAIKFTRFLSLTTHSSTQQFVHVSLLFQPLNSPILMVFNYATLNCRTKSCKALYLRPELRTIAISFKFRYTLYQFVSIGTNERLSDGRAYDEKVPSRTHEIWFSFNVSDLLPYEL